MLYSIHEHGSSSVYEYVTFSHTSHKEQMRPQPSLQVLGCMQACPACNVLFCSFACREINRLYLFYESHLVTNH